MHSICDFPDLDYHWSVLALIKVTGDSLTPTHRPGDYVLIITISWVLQRLKPGEIIVFQHPVYGRMIKRIQQIDPVSGEFFVTGTHPASTDSRQFGTIPPDWVTGKVIWHIPKPGS